MEFTCTDGSVWFINCDLTEERAEALKGLWLSVAEMSRIEPSHTFTRCQPAVDFLGWLGF